MVAFKTTKWLDFEMCLWLMPIPFIYFLSCSIVVEIIHWEQCQNKVQSVSVSLRTNKHKWPVHPRAGIVTDILQLRI